MKPNVIIKKKTNITDLYIIYLIDPNTNILNRHYIFHRFKNNYTLFRKYKYILKKSKIIKILKKIQTLINNSTCIHNIYIYIYTHTSASHKKRKIYQEFKVEKLLTC